MPSYFVSVLLTTCVFTFTQLFSLVLTCLCACDAVPFVFQITELFHFCDRDAGQLHLGALSLHLGYLSGQIDFIYGDSLPDEGSAPECYTGNMEDILWVIPMLRATDTLCAACEDVLAHFEVSHNNLLN